VDRSRVGAGGTAIRGVKKLIKLTLIAIERTDDDMVTVPSMPSRFAWHWLRPPENIGALAFLGGSFKSRRRRDGDSSLEKANQADPKSLKSL